MTPEKLRENIQIVRLAAGDARAKSDHLRSFESLILDNESMYPRIETWYKEKVLPGIKNHERAAFVAYLDQTPIVSAVVKKAARSKICHLRLHRSLQNAHIGEVIFCLMVLEIRDFANELHFTIPESVWVDKGDFFTAFGFTASHTSERQYPSLRPRAILLGTIQPGMGFCAGQTSEADLVLCVWRSITRKSSCVVPHPSQCEAHFGRPEADRNQAQVFHTVDRS